MKVIVNQKMLQINKAAAALIQARWFHFFGHVTRIGNLHHLFRALHTSFRSLPKGLRHRDLVGYRVTPGYL